MGIPLGDSDATTYENELQVPKFNLMSLDIGSIENEIEYLLFVDHAEDMANYTHLQPLVHEVAKTVISIADRAVAEFQRDMTSRIARHLQETMGQEIANVVYDAQIPTTEPMVVKTVVSATAAVNKVEKKHDW